MHVRLARVLDSCFSEDLPRTSSLRKINLAYHGSCETPAPIFQLVSLVLGACRARCHHLTQLALPKTRVSEAYGRGRYPPLRYGVKAFRTSGTATHSKPVLPCNFCAQSARYCHGGANCAKIEQNSPKRKRQDTYRKDLRIALVAEEKSLERDLPIVA